MTVTETGRYNDIPGRPIHENPKNPEAMDLIRHWLQTCDEEHACSSRKDSWLPRRVLDIQRDTSGETAYLTEPASDDQGLYACLSYCWGQGANFVTTKATLDSHIAGVRISELPKTCQDAVHVARSCGVRYLWIDAICILQDDQQDWELESARMDDVYSRAYFTIAADRSPGYDRGFLQPRIPPVYVPLRFATRAGSTTDAFAFLRSSKMLLSDHDVEAIFSHEPLSERGWAYQERVLSPRVIHFAADQLYFEWEEYCEFEDGFIKDWKVPLRSAQETDSRAYQREPTLSLLRRWEAIVKGYTSRKLSKKSDKLPAQAGLAKRHETLVGDEYVAGLWRKSFLAGLCWMSELDRTGIRRQSDPSFRAPSWSWASVDERIISTFCFSDKKPTAEVLDVRVELKGQNRYGELTDGYISLRAPFHRIYIDCSTGEYAGWLPLLKDESDADADIPSSTCQFDNGLSTDDLRSMPLFFVTLLQVEQGTIPAYAGLVVVPVKDQEAVYRRVGMSNDISAEDLPNIASMVGLEHVLPIRIV